MVALSGLPAVPAGFSGIRVAGRPLSLAVLAAPGCAGRPDRGGRPRSIILTWSDPRDDSITGYEVRVSADGDAGAWTAVPRGSAATVSYRLTELDDGTPYGVALRARNALGPGAESPTVHATPRPGICERTAAVRTAILARIDAVTDCADVTDAHLGAVTGELSLAGQTLAALLPGDFAGLKALATLTLSNAGLGAVPAGLFDGLAALAELHLDGNGPYGPAPRRIRRAGRVDGVEPGRERPAGVAGRRVRRVGSADPTRSLRQSPDAVAGEAVRGAYGADGPGSQRQRPERAVGGRIRRAGRPAGSRLFRNNLTELPAALFTPLTALTDLDLGQNPGAPFRFTMTPEQDGADAFRVRVRAGAPFPMTATVAITGGSGAPATVTLRPGRQPAIALP